MDYAAIAAQLIDRLGGKENIGALTHCATRIRVVLNNESKMDKPSIEKIEQVKGLFSLTTQYQIILGAEIVAGVHDEMAKLLA